MGLGGYLTWTAAAREISLRLPEDVKIFPCEGFVYNRKTLVSSPIFDNNPNFFLKGRDEKAFPMFLDNPATNYCERDTLDRAFHRSDKHIIENICQFYNIENPTLKCDLFLTEEEQQKAISLSEKLDDVFVVIEPSSKTNYTPNRSYPFEKWQEVVDGLKNHIQVVQLGLDSSRLLNNVTDYRGRTSFRVASGLIGEASLLLSSEGGLTHAATAVNTTALVIITGYQSSKMVAYPQNINIDIGKHGPCGLKGKCTECEQDAKDHDKNEIINKVLEFLV